jgi:HAD superfamily hydrolase (TIGR01484 family)
MNIKMIVTDLDGTLLRRDKTVSGYTASVFNRCRDTGIKIVFATARPVRAVTKKWMDIDIQNDACIYHNGAVIKIGNKLFQEIGIECGVVKKILDEAKQFENLRISAEINDTLYANFDVSKIWPGIEYTATDFTDIPNLPADKIIFGTTDKKSINKIEQLFNEDLYWEISENEILMVMNKNARKRNAINEVANYFGLHNPC